jgi:redox-sensitive bicupin YhaK (pirin superfamily)
VVVICGSGVGRHADSLGNRGLFQSPGMQWISVGSGIEHAEGGGTPAGQEMAGFQIWINVPSERKMDDPRYGVEPPENIPVLESGDGVIGRLLAGEYGGFKGPFQTVQPVEIIDFELQPNAEYVHQLQENYDNCLGYVYNGDGTVNKDALRTHHMIRLDATDPQTRNIRFAAGSSGMKIILFSGVRLNQPVAWHGPFVMTTDEEIAQTIREYQTGNFLKVRSKWDYKRIATAPAEIRAEWQSCHSFSGEADR